jgi:hypothetical protein
MDHRCAVCWERQVSHQDWYDHATSTHDSILAEFGFDECKGHTRLCISNCKKFHCPGAEHANKLPNFGLPTQHRVKPAAAPFVAKDGTTYTPIPLL